MAEEGNGPSIINNLDTDAQNENVKEEVHNEERQSEDNESSEADHVAPRGQCETRPNGSQDSDLNDNGQNAVEMQGTTLGPSGDAAGSEQTNDFGDGELPSSVTVSQCQSPLEPSAFVPNAAIKPLHSSGDAQENMGVSSIRQSQPLQPDHNGSEIKVKQDESSYSRQVVPGPTGAGDASRSEGPTVLPFKVRDASKESGERDADEAYNRFFSEYHPEYKCRVYRVPPLFVGKNPFVGLKKRNNLLSRSSQNYEVYGPTASDVSGDMAEKNAADCVEHLLNDWINKHEKSPAFIITSFKFVNFCNKTLEPPAADENKYVTEETNGEIKPVQGELDLLIVHYNFGVFFIQVKACGDTVNPDNKVKYAINTQLKKDVEFFNANFQDLNLGISINTAIALPNMQRAKLEENYTKCLKRIQTRYGPDGSHMCLFRDDLPLKDDIEDTLKKENMLKWWRNVTRNCTGFKCFDDYKRVVARYVGFKSTVDIYLSPYAVTQEGRSLSSCVSEIGKRYTKIMLTPQQVYVLNTDLTRLIIRGHYGTGKTVLLILKVRDLIKQGKKVCVVSMSCSPLIHVLEASVKYDIDPIYYDNVIFDTAHDKSSLTKVLKECDAKKQHVFIDEFPSFLFGDECLGKTILDYPPTLMFWCIMSREREEQMSRGPSDIFSSNQMFEEVVMERILRCPPAVQSFVPKTSRKQEREIFGYPEGKLQSVTNCEKMADHFHLLGLSTKKTKELRSLCQPSEMIKWSDVVVIAPERKARPFYKSLLKLEIPLFQVSNMVPVCPTDVHRLLSGLSNKAAYTGSLEGCHFAQTVATIQGTTCTIWFKGHDGRQVVELKEFSDVAAFLHENNFSNKKISKICKQEVKIPRNWGDVIFVDREEVMKPESYTFLECLGVPMVTPSSVNGIITKNAVLFTSENNFEGFQRRETITFDENRVTANMEVRSCMEGPETLCVDHESHEGSFPGCVFCQVMLQDILHKLGLISHKSVSRQTTQGTVSEEKNCSIPATETSGHSPNLLAHPRNDLSFSDMVIIDERQKPESAVELFGRCGVPVIDKLDSVLLKAEELTCPETVLYMKPPLFKGLEKKVVVIIKSPNQRVVSMTKGQITEDSIELAITRCASQLIVILTN